MNNPEYFTIAKKWSEGEIKTPPRNFVKKFMSRLPDDEEYGSDGEEYSAWGYALHGKGEDESGGELFNWDDFYDRVPKDKYPKIGEVVKVGKKDFVIKTLPKCRDYEIMMEVKDGNGEVSWVYWDLNKWAE